VEELIDATTDEGKEHLKQLAKNAEEAKAAEASGAKTVTEDPE
jgi:hypothetical protein